MDKCTKKAIELLEQKKFPDGVKKKVIKSFEELLEIVADNQIYNSNVVTYIDENLPILEGELRLLIEYKKNKDLNKLTSIKIENKKQLEENLQVEKTNEIQTDKIIEVWTDNIRDSKNRILKDIYEVEKNPAKEVNKKAEKIKNEIDKLINKIETKDAKDIFKILKENDKETIKQIIQIKNNTKTTQNEQLRIVDYKIDADKMPTLSTEIFENNIEIIKS